MAMFEENKRKKILEAQKKAAAERKKELEKIIARPASAIPTGTKPKTIPQDYREFLHDVRNKPLSIYERAAALAEKLNLRPSKDSFAAIDENIKAAYMSATPTGILSLAFVIFIFGVLLSAVSFAMGLGSGFVFTIIFLTAIAAYLAYDRPSYKARAVLAKMQSDSILAVLYMIIYMRSSPNLEGGLRFAAENLSGPLAWDLKKLMWSIEIGTYKNASQAIEAYIERWKNKSPEFAESLNLLRGSAVNPERREQLFSETIDIILNGTREHAKHFVSELRMPIMLIHAMGVILPVMGLILFPIVMIFMSNSVKPIFLFIGYDIVLPIALWLLIDYILRGKPTTFSQPDISLVKGVPPFGKFQLGEKLIPILPIALLAGFFVAGIGAYLAFFPAAGACSTMESSANASLLIVAGIAFGIYLYCKMDSMQKIKIRSDIDRIESEFSVGLFQLGNEISSGAPLELAVERASYNLRGMKIQELFTIASGNMRRFGFTFEQALYDKESGAIWYYPSRLIRSIMSALIQSSKKGMAVASDAMVTISKYLKGIHDTREDVDEILGETTTSMRFLGTFLTPLVAGVTITMAVVILQILVVMGTQLQALSSTGSPGGLNGLQSTLTLPWAGNGGAPPIGAGEFQLIVGLYMIETVILLSMFVNRVEFGEDAIGLRAIIASTILMALFIYVASWVVTYSMFGSPIRDLLTPTTLASSLSQCV